MNILYIHGWGSEFDSGSNKVTQLSRLGSVVGPNLDYTQGLRAVLDECKGWIQEHDIDLIVGTSLGGYTASHLGARTGLPFVAVNPAINPRESLEKYLGEGVDHVGHQYHLRPEVIADLPLFNMNGFGLVLLDMDDEVLDSSLTAEFIGSRYPVVTFQGGSHRFEHMEDSLGYVQNLVNNAQTIYGLETE